VLIRELELTTPSLADARRFYAGELGLESVDDQAGLTVLAGATRVRFVPGEPGSAYHVAFDVPENRIADALAWIAERSDPLVVDGSRILDFRDWNAHALYVLDPLGNVIELIARHALPTASNRPFGPDALLRVSEIGLPAPDPSALVADLATVGIGPWKPGSASFAPLGDEWGLAIVVAEGRSWFPTDRPAAIAPVAIVADADRDADIAPGGLPYRLRLRRSAAGAAPVL
jgi:catechol 2,3-dioxygenase-like lactoylglutathione lyase family enzyme